MTLESILLDPHFLAASSAEQAGRITGALLGVVLMVAIPTLFVISLVRFIATKKGGWLAGAIVTALLGLGFVGFGIYSVATKAGKLASSPKTVESAEGTVHARIPGHWVTLKDLSKVATLQVGNGLREEYFMVLSEPKANFEGDVEEYSEITSSHMLKAMTDGERLNKKTLVIDGRPAVQYEIKGSINKIPIDYLQTTVETENGFHQLLMWTLKSKRDIAWPVFQEVLDSVKLEDPKSDKS